MNSEAYFLDECINVTQLAFRLLLLDIKYLTKTHPAIVNDRENGADSPLHNTSHLRLLLHALASLTEKRMCSRSTSFCG